MKRPAHLFLADDGALYDTRRADWHTQPPLRRCFEMHCAAIHDTHEFKATLRAGAHTWPGCYPLYFITSDGAPLSFESARKCLREILQAIKDKDGSGWRVVACEPNWEDAHLYCDYSGKRIASAYTEEDAEIERGGFDQ